MNNPDLFATACPLKLLVSDCDPWHRDETIKLLIEMGYQPNQAVSDEALLSLAEKGGYDVVLLNVRIGGRIFTEEVSETVQRPRPLLIGIAPSAKLDLTTSAGCVASDILLFRPTTKEELMVQLRACCILAGKYSIDASDG